MPTKSFKGFVPQEQIVIELESPDGTRQATFKCRSIPGNSFLKYMERSADRENVAVLAGTMRDILDSALLPSDQAAFWDFCDEPENGITMEVLSNVASYLTDVFSGSGEGSQRPTEPRPA